MTFTATAGFRRLAPLVLGLLMTIGTLAIATVPARGQESDVAKVTHLLERDGYKYEKKSENVWTVAFTAKSLSNFKVILSCNDGLLVMFVIPMHKQDFQLTAAFMQRLLKFNHEMDRVKVGIDDDGDLFVRIDETVRILDDKEFKENIEQLAAAANEVYAGVKT